MVVDNFKLAARVLFFGTLEESFSLGKALRLSDSSEKVDLVRKINVILMAKYSKKITGVQFDKGLFKIPPGLDFSFWREFRLNESPEVFKVVLLKWIGGIENKVICEALEISEGTLKTRYNKGLLSLGRLIMGSRIKG